MKKKSFILFFMIFASFFTFENTLTQEHQIAYGKFTIVYDKYHSWHGENLYSKFNLKLSENFKIEYINKKIEKKNLSGCDILIIPSPIKAFSEEEVDNIKKFVENGGGLLLMGVGWAWTDYHGGPVEDFPFNQIANEFGVALNDDIIFDPTESHILDDSAYTIFTNFAAHSVTEGLTRVQAGIPSSLSITGNAIPIVMGDEDSYSSYRSYKLYKPGDFPPVAAALEFGKGRMLFVGHDGFISNTDLEKYDNIKFGVNMINWLCGDTSILRIICLSGNAVVYINDKGMGQTPLDVGLEPGTYKIEIVEEGYEKYTFDVTLEKNKIKILSVQLLPSIHKSQTFPSTLRDYLFIICDVLIISVIFIFFQRYRKSIKFKKIEKGKKLKKLSVKELEKLRRKLDEDYVEDRISRKEYLRRKDEINP